VAAGATADATTGATGAAEVARRVLAGLVIAAAAAAAATTAAPAGPTVEVKVSRSGFEPARVVLRRGETTRLVISTADAEHCFAIDGLRIEKRVTSDHPTRLELTPERTGSFPFYCCVESGKQAEVERGELVVTE
jgi:heme/copper-type cytochrome/quinol oxidase subunit 2